MCVDLLSYIGRLEGWGCSSSWIYLREDLPHGLYASGLGAASTKKKKKRLRLCSGLILVLFAKQIRLEEGWRDFELSLEADL